MAELQVQRALDIYEAADGHHSLGVATCRNNLGRIYENRNQNEEGVKFLEEAATIRKDILGTHPDTAFTLLNYGTGLAALDKFLDASRVLAKAAEMYSALGMDDNQYARAARDNLKVCQAHLQPKACDCYAPYMGK